MRNSLELEQSFIQSLLDKRGKKSEEKETEEIVKETEKLCGCDIASWLYKWMGKLKEMNKIYPRWLQGMYTKKFKIQHNLKVKLIFWSKKKFKNLKNIFEILKKFPTLWCFLRRRSAAKRRINSSNHFFFHAIFSAEVIFSTFMPI
jgi:hypothetical protein